MPELPPTDLEGSEATQFISRPPGWLVRNGILLFSGVVVLLLILSWMVRYPDVVPARITLLGAQPPVRIVAGEEGRLQEILVEENETVPPQKVLIVLQNTAQLSDVRQLERLLNSAAERPETLDLPSLQLGPLQNLTARLRREIADYDNYRRRDPVARRLLALDRQEANLRALQTSVAEQVTFSQESILLAREQLARDSQLVSSGARSLEELERSRAALTDLRRRQNRLESSRLDYELQLRELDSQRLQLEQTSGLATSDRLFQLESTYRELQAAIADWYDRFVLRAPVAGRVRFTQPLSIGRFAARDEELLTLVPTTTPTTVYGRAEIPLAGYGKVTPGMRVNVRLEAFPYREFGSLNGTLVALSEVPEDNRYLGRVAFPDSLVTTYGTVIPYLPELPGSGRIITRKRRLAERIWTRILAALTEENRQ